MTPAVHLATAVFWGIQLGKAGGLAFRHVKKPNLAFLEKHRNCWVPGLLSGWGFSSQRGTELLGV